MIWLDYFTLTEKSKKWNEGISTFSPLYKDWSIQGAVVRLFSAVSRDSIQFSHDIKVGEGWTVRGQCFSDMNPSTSLIFISFCFIILLFMKGAIFCHWIGYLLTSSNYTKKQIPCLYPVSWHNLEELVAPQFNLKRGFPKAVISILKNCSSAMVICEKGRELEPLLTYSFH